MSDKAKKKWENRPGSGSLFRNQFLQPGQAGPEYKGAGAVQCPCCNKVLEINLGAWVKTSARGTKYFSLSLKASDTGAAPAPRAAGWKPGAQAQPARPAPAALSRPAPQTPPAAATPADDGGEVPQMEDDVPF